MICSGVKQGIECFFMNKNGCQFNGGGCNTVIEQCNGCQKAKAFATGSYCVMFPDPAIKWRTGKCNMATHLAKASPAKPAAKMNPLKASKRGIH